MKDGSWPAVHRIVHLGGGLRAINPALSKEIEIIPQLGIEKFILSLTEFGGLYARLRKENLKIIGVEFYDHAMQADGLLPPNWRPFNSAPNEIWPVTVCEETWGNLAHSAFKQNDFYFLELARRIQFQLTSCIWELRSISEAYSRELEATCRLKEYKDGQRFESQNSLFIYMSVHAFFSSLGTLRDYLAEYVAAFPLKGAIPDKRITKMVSLIKELRKIGDKSNPIAAEILMISDHKDKNGWLATRSDYRDLVVHYAPIAYASGRSFLTKKSIFVYDVEIPGIYFPLPPNPFELLQKRSKGALHENVKDWLDYSVNYKPTDADQDTLEYCHLALFCMCRFAMQMAGFAPYKAEIPLITEKDLKGPVVTTRYNSRT